MWLKGHLFLTLPISVPGRVTPKSLKLIKCKIKYVSLETVGKQCVFCERKSVIPKQVFSRHLFLDIIMAFWSKISPLLATEIEKFCFVCSEDPSHKSIWCVLSLPTPRLCLWNSKVPKLWNNGITTGVPSRQASISLGRIGPAHLNLYQHRYICVFCSGPATACFGINSACAGRSVAEQSRAGWKYPRCKFW